MSSVIATLLDNAVKYSGDSAEIRISAEEKDGHVRISVHDKGIGIAPEKQAHISVESELGKGSTFTIEL